MGSGPGIDPHVISGTPNARTREQGSFAAGTSGSSSAVNAAPSSSFAGVPRAAGADADNFPRTGQTTPLRIDEQNGTKAVKGGPTSAAAADRRFCNLATTSPRSSYRAESPGAGTPLEFQALPAAFPSLIRPVWGVDFREEPRPILDQGPLQIQEHTGVGRINFTSGSSSMAAVDRKLKSLVITSPPSIQPTCSSSKAENPSGERPLVCQAPAGASPSLIRPVWDVNFQEEMRLLRSILLEGRVTIALDMEFVSVVEDQQRPSTSSQWYRNVSELVSAGYVLQLGLAIAPESSSSSSEGVTVKEINLKFNVQDRPYNKKTLEFLKEHHDFDALKSDGIPSAVLSEWFLTEFDRFYDRRVTWVVFQGDYDIAFFLDLLGNAMPDTLAGHLRRYTCSFPLLYDVRTLSRLIFGPDAEGLNWLAGELNVQRRGNDHSSGSDALLTLECFFELRSRLGVNITHSLIGVLSGLFDVESIVSRALPMGHVSLEEVHVWDHNFDSEAALIAEAVLLDYHTLGVDVSFSPVPGQRKIHPDNQGCYELTMCAIREVGLHDVSLALVSYTGQLPKGKWWRFHLTEHPNAPDYIHSTRFGKFLDECNLLANDRIIWATFEGAEGIASLCRMVQHSRMQEDIPLRFQDYAQLRRHLFPALYDIGKLVSCENGMELAVTARRLGLNVPDQQSGWIALLCAQVMVRLRETLEESDSQLRAFACQRGLLVAKCCPIKRLSH